MCATRVSNFTTMLTLSKSRSLAAVLFVCLILSEINNEILKQQKPKLCSIELITHIGCLYTSRYLNTLDVSRNWVLKPMT